MKILFHNYSNELTTEPMYLSNALRQCGIEATLWADPSVSAFDAFDTATPDVFITHAYSVTPDIFKYLSQSKKVDLVLNVTGLSEAQITDIEQYCENSGVNCPFIFTNRFSFDSKPQTKLKFERIYPAFDLFLARPAMSDKSLPSAILSQELGESVDKATHAKEVYHLVQVTNGDMVDGFDIRTNVNSIPPLYSIYEQFTLAGDANFCSSQLFFDLNYNTHNIGVECSDYDNFLKFLSEAFENTDTGEDIRLQVRDQIKNRHTPFHRAATLCKHLKAKDAMQQVERAKTQLSEILKDK